MSFADILFVSDLLKFKVNVSEANQKETRKLCKDLHQYIFLLRISHQPANFRDERS